MKPFVLSASRPLRRAVVTVSMLGALLAHTSLHAATFYWDNNGTTSGFGTAGGTWDAAGSILWLGNSTGGADATLGTSYTTTSSDALNFGTAADGLAPGTITVSGTVNASTLTFGSASGAIEISGGTIDLGTGTTPAIGANPPGIDLTINTLQTKKLHPDE